MTDTYFQLRYIQTSSRNAVNKKLFLNSLLFLTRSHRDVQDTIFRMSLTDPAYFVPPSCHCGILALRSRDFCDY